VRCAVATNIFSCFSSFLWSEKSCSLVKQLIPLVVNYLGLLFAGSTKICTLLLARSICTACQPPGLVLKEINKCVCSALWASWLCLLLWSTLLCLLPHKSL
jgi:hypothetical protein